MKAVALSLIILSASMACVFAAEDADLAEFKQIDATEFGKTLLDTVTIQLQAQSGDAAGTVRDMLQDMLNSLRAEGKRDRSENNVRQGTCQGEIEGINVALREAETSKADSTQSKVTTEGELDASVRERSEKAENHESLQSDLKQLDLQREAEFARFEETLAEFNHLRETLEEAKGVMQGLLAPNIAGFLQEPETLAQRVSEKLNKFESKNKLALGLGKIAKFAANLLQRPGVDSQLVQRVIEIIDQLIRKYEDLDGQTRRREVQDSTNYQDRRVDLSSLVYNLASDVARLVAVENELNQTIITLSNDLDRFQRIIDGKNTELADTTKVCRDADFEYNERRARRKQQKKVIKQVIAILDSKIGKFRKYIKDRNEEED